VDFIGAKALDYLLLLPDSLKNSPKSFGFQIEP